MPENQMEIIQNGKTNIYVENKKNVNFNVPADAEIKVDNSSATATTGIVVSFGNENLSVDDAKILQDFRKDFDDVIWECVERDFTVAGIPIDLYDRIHIQCLEPWERKSLKARNKHLRKLIFDIMQTLNDLSAFLDIKYMRTLELGNGDFCLIPKNESYEDGEQLREVLRPSTERLRYKLRDLYVELHPEDYEDITPFENPYRDK